MQELIKRGHVIGSGMISPDKKYFYLNIPKNASTFTTNLLKANDWSHWNLSNRDFENVIVVLRNPIDRWISGIATYLCSYILGENYGSDHFINDYNEATERLIFDNVIFDDHTTPQIKFISEIPGTSKRIFITPQNDNLVKLLNTTLGCKLIVPDNIFNNSAETNYDIKQISNFIRSRLTLEKRVKITNAYREDFQLFDRPPLHNNDAR
jgi:hypothetical protein